MIAQKYECVVLDTLNQPMNDVYVEHMKDKGNPTFDKWRDYGVEVLTLYTFIRNLPGAVLVQITGKEGTGKTVGARTLNPQTTMYLNADRKPLTFAGAEDMYPPDGEPGMSNSLANYKEIVPRRNGYGKVEPWTPIMEAIQYAYDNRAHKKFVVFVLAHTEVYKGANGIENEKLRVLGNMATKLNIEGSLVWAFYTKVDPIAMPRSAKYKLTMHNSGFNTARSPMGVFDEVEEIPNDFKLILDVIQGNVTNLKQVQNEQSV
jgi:hypothetical protein